MNIDAYLNSDFTLTKKFIFLLMTFLGLGICIAIIYGISRLYARGYQEGKREEYFKEDFDIRTQRFFEMIIAGTSVMTFSCAYVIINHVYSLVQAGNLVALNEADNALIEAWTEGKDFVLLLLICLSCVINTIIDSLIIPLKILTKEEKATMRMLGMFYVIIILIFLNVIGDESQYGPVMMYYFGLMIGRFVYFDASFGDFINNIRNVFVNLPILLLTLALTAALCLVGFKAGYFLERNYYIVGIFYAHLFMLVCIFLIHHGRNIIDIIKRNKK